MKHPRLIPFVLVLLMMLAGCGDDASPRTPAASDDDGEHGSDGGGDGDTGWPDAGDGDSDPDGPDAGDGDGHGDGDGDGDGDAHAQLDAPANAEELLPFLMAKKYADWAAEPDYHASSGPHGDAVRVFYSPRAAAALEQHQDTFPRGAATVKELTSDGFLYGWAVWTKVQQESDEGNGFYWYEIIGEGEDAMIYGDGLGHSDCVYCHAPGKDFLLSTAPFE